MKRSFLTILMAAALAGTVRASDKGDLILSWSFDRPDGNTFRDGSGHGRDGAAFDLGADQIVWQSGGQTGSAIELQGDGRNLVKCDEVDSAAYPGGSFTLELWAKDLTSKAIREGNLGAVIAMQRSGVNVAWSLGIRKDGSLRFFTNAGGTPTTHDTAAIPWEDGVWYRIVLSCRADGQEGQYRVECFKGDRAAFVDKFAAPAPQMEGPGSFIIGGDHASTALDRNLAGWIDEVRYFKSPELPGAPPNANQTKN